MITGFLKCYVTDFLSYNRFSDFIPPSVGERTVLQSSPDGNCIFHTMSIILYGDESFAMTLKLATVVHMVDYLIPFAKYVSMKKVEREIY